MKTRLEITRTIVAPVAANYSNSMTNIRGQDTNGTRVFLLMANRLMRDTLAHVLQRREDMELAGRSGPDETTPEEVERSNCDVVLVDFVETKWLAQLRGKCPRTGGQVKVVAIGMDPERAEFLNAVRCGVIGFLLKDASASEVVTAVRAAVRGEATCPPQMCMLLFQELAQIDRNVQANRSGQKAGLTLRQQLLMRQVAKGLTNKEIATQLNLSEFTVRNHISRILKQLKAETRGEAVDAVLGFEFRVGA